MRQKLVVVKTYRTSMEAHVDRLALEGAGLQVFMEDENYELGEGPGWPADGVKLAVPDGQAIRAAELLGEREGQ